MDKTEGQGTFHQEEKKEEQGAKETEKKGPCHIGKENTVSQKLREECVSRGSQ